MEEKTARPATLQDSGFVLEDRAEGLPVYYDLANTQPGSYAWTTNRKAHTVLRFARQTDGERFMQKHMPHLIGQVTVVPL